MNSLGRLDSYISSLFNPPSTSRKPSTTTPPPQNVPPPATLSDRLSNLPPTPSHRRKLKRTSTPLPSLPPPSTPILLRIVLALWSILVSFWRSLVGETRAERSRRKKRRLASRVRSKSSLSRQADGVGSSDDGSASEGDAVPSGDESWVDPVTRAVEVDVDDTPQTSGDEDFVQTTTLPPPPASRLPDSTFSFRLRSAEKRETISMTGSYDNTSHKSSILSNPIVTPSESRPANRLKLLPNPMMNSLLDPSVPSTRSPSPIRIHPTHPPRLHQTPFHLGKTLILDLDETLIHSTSRPISYAGLQGGAGGGLLGLSFGGLLGGKRRGEGHQVEVVINGRSTMYHVYKRPYVDHFLKKVASWYTLVIFTASMPEYADPVIDWLDGGRGFFAKRLYRESCSLQTNGSYIKDLALVEKDLGRVCFMDNSPVSYNWNKANALPIEGWTSDPNDEALLHSIPVLDSLRFVNDVRGVLGIRGFS